MGVSIADKGHTIATSTDKGKTFAETSVEATIEPKATKKGSKRKAAAATEEIPLRISYKKRRRSERIFNQKMKKSAFEPNGKGSTPDKALSLN
nr:pectin lyase-like superfamily protein [Tanacetum cinerariifolium]